MRTYVAFFKSNKLVFEAASLWDAKQHAVRHFKPSKRDAGLLSVILADAPIDPASL